MKRFIGLGFLILLLSLVVTSPAAAQTNLLIDPSFEGESYVFISRDPLAEAVTYSVPAGWGGGVVLAPRNSSWQNVHPTGFPNIGVYALSGNRSFSMARGGGTFTAYVFQQVNVTPGTPVQAGGWAFIENTSGTSIVRAGIDPTGGGNPFSPSVVWSNWAGAVYQWNQVSVSSNAVGGTVTLFLYATQSAPADPNAVYWDNAFVYGTPGAAPVTGGSSNQTVLTPNVRVNVRSGAGTNYSRLGRINPGEYYRVLGDAGGGWLSIDYNGQTGYVSSQYVTVSQGQPSAPASGGGQTPPATNATYIAVYNVRLRSGPATSTGTLANIPFNTTLPVLGRSGDGNWIQVSFNGQVGWVAARYGTINGSSIPNLPVTG